MDRRVHDASGVLGSALEKWKRAADPAAGLEAALVESWGVLEEDLPPDLWMRVKSLRKRMLGLPAEAAEREGLARDLARLAGDVQSLANGTPPPGRQER
jgi:hypothetical protein